MSDEAPAAAPEVPDGPGIWLGLANEVYHAGPGISKSGLWEIWTKTPAHYRYPPEREIKEHFEIGSAIDIAILEPYSFEKRVSRGPDDRRGNKWKDAAANALSAKMHLLKGADYDAVLTVRDAIMANSFLNNLLTGGVADDTNLTQPSAYWVDQQTGLLCRARPDKVRTDIGVMLDLKSARSAAPLGFSKACGEYGYHCQEGWYTEGWAAAGEAPIEGMLFLAVEPESPYAWGLYELTPEAVAEGNAIMRKSLGIYAECSKTDVWPAYSEGVVEIDIPRWAYRITAPPAYRQE